MKNPFTKISSLSKAEKGATIATLVVIIVFFTISYLTDSGGSELTANQNIESTKPIATAVTNISNSKDVSNEFWLGSEELCTKGAQIVTESFNKSSADLPPPFLPSFRFVLWSHYVPSQNSCYFEQNYEMPLPANLGGGSVNTYELYVTGGPTTADIKNKFPLSVLAASCSLFTPAQCKYFAPKMSQQAWENKIAAGLWTTQFNFDNARPISEENYQTLVAKFKTLK